MNYNIFEKIMQDNDKQEEKTAYYTALFKRALAVTRKDLVLLYPEDKQIILKIWRTFINE